MSRGYYVWCVYIVIGSGLYWLPQCFMMCIIVLCCVLIWYGPLFNSSPFEYELKGQLLFVVRHFYSCNKLFHCQVIGAFNYFILKQVLVTDTHARNMCLRLIIHNTLSTCVVLEVNMLCWR